MSIVSGNTVLGVLMGLLSLLGLFMASRAVDGMFYATGLFLFGFGVVFNFILITKSTGGAAESGASETSHSEPESESQG